MQKKSITNQATKRLQTFEILRLQTFEILGLTFTPSYDNIEFVRKKTYLQV